MPQDLDNVQQAALRKAMMDGFTVSEIDRLLKDKLNITRENIALGDDKEDILFKVIEHFERDTKVHQLASAVIDARPGNTVVQGLVNLLKLGTYDRPEGQLEALVRADEPTLDLLPWMAKAERLRRQVCRIEYPVSAGTIYGTGFLVGPDLVMTNHHVIQHLKDGDGRVADVDLVFDYIVAEDGMTIGNVQNVGLADAWLVDWRPHSRADVVTSGGGDPEPDELDFALLRINQKLGEEDLPDGNPRGWIDICPSLDAFSDDMGLQILQHPEGRPLKITLGRLTEVTGQDRRLRYDANTDGGSSGSPVFDRSWRLVGLHHAGDPNYTALQPAAYNQAIPLHLIRNHLTGNGNLSCP